ncbi:hypothetical protein [Polaribacter sp. IC073]|uniref:hypothetical protein n=1 Tax=Polaribacter sp. IC073 TaxID=2508540 RepID=UPI0011BDE753|nr:hypothetical protein [Polaribacter sp. IC073]TXD47320.1 hypothetical protein ES045_12035 [Polaribacter sp. IC073]
MPNQQEQNEQWKLLVSNLREKAIAKFGNGWQTALAEITGFTQSNISRMFGLKYAPNLKNYTILAAAINLINENHPVDTISKFLVSIDKNNDEMYVLHRQDPCYLVHVKQETPMRFILIESYDDEWQDESLLLHPSINEMKKYITELFSSKENFNLN